MSTPEHTPGPWEAELLEEGEFFVFVPPAVDMGTPLTICKRGRLKHRTDESHANARLIAAAPELLEACKVAFDQTCSVGRPKDWEQLRAAIAKATGNAA